LAMDSFIWATVETLQGSPMGLARTGRVVLGLRLWHLHHVLRHAVRFAFIGIIWLAYLQFGLHQALDGMVANDSLELENVLDSGNGSDLLLTSKRRGRFPGSLCVFWLKQFAFHMSCHL